MITMTKNFQNDKRSRAIIQGEEEPAIDRCKLFIERK